MTSSAATFKIENKVMGYPRPFPLRLAARTRRNSPLPFQNWLFEGYASAHYRFLFGERHLHAQGGGARSAELQLSENGRFVTQVGSDGRCGSAGHSVHSAEQLEVASTSVGVPSSGTQCLFHRGYGETVDYRGWLGFV